MVLEFAQPHRLDIDRREIGCGQHLSDHQGCVAAIDDIVDHQQARAFIGIVDRAKDLRGRFDLADVATDANFAIFEI